MINVIPGSKPDRKSMKAERKRVAAEAEREIESLRSLAERPKDGGRSSGQGMDGAPSTKAGPPFATD